MVAFLLLIALSADTDSFRDIAYGEHVRQRLDLTVPDSEEPVPCVVFFHGGGFFMGDKAMHDRERKTRLLNAGIAFATANYRLTDSGPYPQPMLDAARAIQFLRTNAKEYGLDPDRFAADGRSAGGAMALWLAYHPNLADPKAADPVLRESTRLTCVAAGHCLPTFDYAVLCNAFGCRTLKEHPAAYTLFGVQEGETRESRRMARLISDASPMTHFTRDDPDTFLYYKLRRVPVTPRTEPNLWVHHPNAGLPLLAASRKNGVPVQLEYPGARTADRDVVAFFTRRLLDSK